MGATCCKQEDEEIDYSQGPELSHFELLKIIGKGAFGKVRIVQHKKTKKQYALKYIQKSICIKQRATNNIILERNLLEKIDYPLIANLRYAFQDDETLFMALDFMLGGDLRSHLISNKKNSKKRQQQQHSNEHVVKYHVASLALSIHYLHTKKRIVHRDIKPENILIDKKGYAHLSDFNMAIQFDPTHQPLLWNMAGTMAYMAPEMVARKGYSTSVDWWSLGIVAYELLFGMRPFKARSKDALTNSIIHDPIVFPNNAYEIVSKDCIDVINGLLDKSPFHRLGCNNTPDGFEKFKSHPWFQGLDWDLLEKKQLTLPSLIDKKKKSKKLLRLFATTTIQEEAEDEDDEEEEQLFTEDGLIAHQATMKRNSLLSPPTSPTNPKFSYIDAVTEEARYRMQLEDEFLNFDYSQHQMVEDSSLLSHFLEQRRNSLKRQYERFKRRSTSSFLDSSASAPGPIHLPPDNE